MGGGCRGDQNGDHGDQGRAFWVEETFTLGPGEKGMWAWTVTCGTQIQHQDLRDWRVQNGLSTLSSVFFPGVCWGWENCEQGRNRVTLVS